MTLTSTDSELNIWIFWEIQFTFFYEFTPSLGPGSISWQQELSGAVSLQWSHIILILTCALLSCSWDCLASTPLLPEEFYSSSPKEQTAHHPLLMCWVQHYVVAHGSHFPPPQPDHSSKGKCIWNVKMKSRGFLNHFSAARRGFPLRDRSPWFLGSGDEFPECIHTDICCYPLKAATQNRVINCLLPESSLTPCQLCGFSW